MPSSPEIASKLLGLPRLHGGHELGDGRQPIALQDGHRGRQLGPDRRARYAGAPCHGRDLRWLPADHRLRGAEPHRGLLHPLLYIHFTMYNRYNIDNIVYIYILD